ncbi:hypothetical protein, partial [Enhygromyxa salina]
AGAEVVASGLAGAEPEASGSVERQAPLATTSASAMEIACLGVGTPPCYSTAQLAALDEIHEAGLAGPGPSCEFEGA